MSTLAPSMLDPVTIMLALVVLAVVIIAAYLFVEEPPAGPNRGVDSTTPRGAAPAIPAARRAAVQFEVFARRAGFSPSHDGTADLAETSQ